MAEFAVCLPVIMVIVLAAIEACSMIFLRQALQATAYEAVRMAVVASARTTDCANTMLDQRKVQQGTVNLSAETDDLGTWEIVTVTAPIESNRLMPPWFFGSGNLTAKCVMLREAN